MGDAYHGAVLIVRKHLKAFHDTRAVLAVEIARGLAAQDQPGVVCKRARDRHPLTLPARQAIDGVLCLPAQPGSGQQLHRAHFGLGTIETAEPRSEEHTSELQSLMRISYAVFCLKKKKTSNTV